MLDGRWRWTRVWVLFALASVLALTACATGAAPCAITRPLSVVTTLLAAGISLFDGSPSAY
ncbi:MAG: hypothetical protein EXR64_01195 [Dehalococcoidia bacterium]|nr:hypothetical protein [Dehalococcoidia bacterium]